MSISLTLTNPDNASNPTSLEQVIQENNEAIIEAFSKAFSREATSGPNYLWTNLDLNGYALLNVGESEFLTAADVSEIAAGEFRKNTDTDALEYKGPDDEDWTELYTLEELKGPAGDGDGDLLSTNNLSDLTSASAARANLGLIIGTNVMAFDAVLNAFDPDDKADTDDYRFNAFPVTVITASTTASTWGRLYRFEGATASQEITVPTSTDGYLNSFYIDPDSPSVDLVAGAGVTFYLAGSDASQTTATILPGGTATVICSSTDGTRYILSGSGVS